MHKAHLFDDARKTWDTVRQIVDNNRNKFEFTKCFHINRLRVTHNNVIANAFNELFVNIGSKLANSIKSNTNDSVQRTGCCAIQILHLPFLHSIMPLIAYSSTLPDMFIHISRENQILTHRYLLHHTIHLLP